MNVVTKSGVALAVNYSHAARDLVKQRQIELDHFKAPAWPELVTEAQRTLPVNVHFPLTIGHGGGDAERRSSRPACELAPGDERARPRS